LIDQLWRLELNQEAWETWRSETANPNPSPQELLLEGRLRLGVGDHWNGLSRLWRASLRLVSPACRTRNLLHNSLHPRPLLPLFLEASEQEKVRLELLLAIARQESRFSPGVASPVGALGLLQLMPATAAEMAGEELSADDLREPGRNAILGARYLAGLLNFWQGNPWLTVASYNAGPGAAGSWLSPELESDPELWVERIPYPETRLYTKKVLGNLWAYLSADSATDSATEQCTE
jgi:soluble lytic murein transglycosylase